LEGKNNSGTKIILLFAAHPIVCKKHSLHFKPQASQAAAVLYVLVLSVSHFICVIECKSAIEGFILGSFDSAIAGLCSK
jgi:hypothetical protein